MRRILFILLLAGNLDAKQYTFECIDDQNESSSLVIDTDKKFLMLGRASYDIDWNETETTIDARCNSKEACSLFSVSFNKITGVLISTADRDSIFGDIVLERRCKSVQRLIP